MKITVENFRGNLRIRFTHQGERQCIALGIADNPTARAYASQLASTIELDILSRNFDKSLLKYKPQTIGKSATEISAVELFDRYTGAMKTAKALSKGALCKYQGVKSHLVRVLGDRCAESVSAQVAGNFTTSLLEQVLAYTAKQYLFLLAACWDWAKGKYRIADRNPWVDEIAKVKPDLRRKVKPFSSTEILMIQAAFKAHPQYCHYHELVCFLFGTGCRFGEAVGLRWRNVADDFSHIIICEAISRGEHRNQTKTGKARTIKLNPGIVIMLRSRFEHQSPSPDSLVFASPKGKPIDDHNFNRRAWKTIISQTGIEYRKPYSTRHTAISHALANGANYIAVAEASGHDARVLHQSYASSIEQISVFKEF